MGSSTQETQLIQPPNLTLDGFIRKLGNPGRYQVGVVGNPDKYQVEVFGDPGKYQIGVVDNHDRYQIGVIDNPFQKSGSLYS